MAPIGIIGAMDAEVNGLIKKLESHKIDSFAGMEFHTGKLLRREVVIARCGVGKVFAAMCAEAMIIKYSPSLIVNTGVAGGLDAALKCADIVVAEKLCQHDMDTSPLGDEKGLISGINRVYFESDSEAVDAVMLSGYELGITVKRGTIATGDQFVATDSQRERIVREFGASACEMEGCAIAQTAFVAGVPFVVVRAISDGANSDSAMDFPTFLNIAAKKSEALTLALVEKYQK
ncbi:MAG: 5'-methylthioadenosine/adenosylhomocysteine nucleosidase [Clostridia bacterium]|nr:5'-methylthioadenosine/adenosylhomocysteine nucleosidase [Clostridia bacterium]